MIKVLVTFGTRPEAIKMCPVVKELQKRDEIETVICVTGQHREMLHQVLTAFEVDPDYDLAIMKEGQNLFDITANVMMGLKPVLEAERPDIVLVHGDTTTSFAAGLTAFYLEIPVGHVEAGLRTYDIRAPYPEEFNRQAVGIFTDLHFAPTQLAKDNLLREGKKEESVFITGNTAIDALKYTVSESYEDEITKWAKGSRLIAMTAHRRENIGKPFEEIFSAINDVVNKHDDVKVVYPVHPNPKVKEAAQKYLGSNERIKLIQPQEIIEFHNLLAKSFFIMTDSGGIQEEAPSLGKPVLVLRNVTERPEGVTAGTLKIAGCTYDSVADHMELLLSDEKLYREMAAAKNPYGDGFASERIADIILAQFGRM